ncbi:hypothetical protein [Promicromonospora sp. NPDC090134]|uniref:hypothetical protein n=1 Tax=Promicromonospora sp. NPDC090134 TaxID=3364408 RepID=UPI00382D3DA9
MRDDGLRRAGWGPLRWPWERCWIRRAEELVDRELARWIDPPKDAPSEPDVESDVAEHVENPDGSGARPG